MNSRAVARLAGLLLVAASSSSQAQVNVSGTFDITVANRPGVGIYELRDPYGSRVTFSGVEDLGGGLKTVFFLEHRFNPNDGTQAGPVFWNGGSYVGLQSPYGRLIAGRYWDAAFLNVQNVLDPFTSDLASLRDKGVRFSPAMARFANGFRYDVNIGKFGIGADISPSGLTNSGAKDPTVVNRPWSATLTWADGPVWLGIAHENEGGAYDHITTLGAKYTISGITLRAGTSAGRNNANQNVTGYLLAFNIPIGVADFHVGYATNKKNGVAQTKTFAIGYDYFLSKRTKLYTDVVYDSALLNRKSGFDFGIQHKF